MPIVRSEAAWFVVGAARYCGLSYHQSEVSELELVLLQTFYSRASIPRARPLPETSREPRASQDLQVRSSRLAPSTNTHGPGSAVLVRLYLLKLRANLARFHARSASVHLGHTTEVAQWKVCTSRAADTGSIRNSRCEDGRPSHRCRCLRCLWHIRETTPNSWTMSLVHGMEFSNKVKNLPVTKRVLLQRDHAHDFDITLSYGCGCAWLYDGYSNAPTPVSEVLEGCAGGRGVLVAQ